MLHLQQASIHPFYLPPPLLPALSCEASLAKVKESSFAEFGNNTPTS